MGEKKRRQANGGGGNGSGEWLKEDEFTMHVIDVMPAEERQERLLKATAAKNAAIAVGADMNVWLRKHFESHVDVVFGVWPDKHEPGGIGVAILRGKGRIMLTSQTSQGAASAMVNLRCNGIEEAEAMCRVFGDGRRMAA